MGSMDDPAVREGADPLLLDSNSRSYAVTRTINFRILPIFLAMASLCYIDRTNTAFASLQMNRDLKFSAEAYGLGSGLFFLGYALSMIPSQLVLMRVGAPRWLATIVTCWGLTAMSFSTMKDKYQFWFLRVCLGIFESGAFPGMWFYLNSFYPPDSITLPYSLIEAAVGVANVAGAPLAAALLLLDGTGGWSGWRWLFLLEGLPSVCVGISMLYVLPKDFQSADFFTTADKAWLAQAHGLDKKHALDAEGLSLMQLLLDACRNHRVWLVGVAALLKNAAMVGILFWCPIIVNAILRGSTIDMAAGSEVVEAATAGKGGHHGLKRMLLASIGMQEKGVEAVLLTAVPFLTAAICAVWVGHRSQQKREKCMHAAVPYFISALLFIAFPYVAEAGGVAAFVCLVLAITSLTCPNAIVNSLASSVSQGPSSAISLALYNAVGNVGGLVGPWLIGRVVQATGLYAIALQVLGLMVAAAGGLCCCFRHWNM